jgi:hypothetical protein
MSNPLAERNFDWSEMANESNSLEFSQFFSKKKLAGGKIAFRVKKEALSQVDILYFTLPKCGKAIDIVCKTTVNKGVQILKGSGEKDEITDADEILLQNFLSSMRPNPIEFLEDIIRMKKTKGNLLVCLTQNLSKEYIWGIIEPERFSVVSNVENQILSKYDIDSFLLHKKRGAEILDKKTTLFVRSSPASILGVPPLLFNHLYSKTIVSEVKKNFQIQDNGAFKKSLMSAKKIVVQAGEVKYESINVKDLAKLSEQIKSCQKDPTKSIQIVDVEVNLTELPTIDFDPTFNDRYDGSYTLHTASITGVAPYRLLPPASINRATAQQQYSEMIEDTIQPANNSLTNLVQAMFEIWCLATKNESKIQLTIQNPKPMLDIDISAEDLRKLENGKQITTNELRDRLSLEAYSEEQQKDRDDYRIATTKQPKLVTGE